MRERSKYSIRRRKANPLLGSYQIYAWILWFAFSTSLSDSRKRSQACDTRPSFSAPYQDTFLPGTHIPELSRFQFGTTSNRQPSSPPSPSSPIPPHRHPNPKSTLPRHNPSHEPIGLVFANKKFKCTKPTCKNLIFGRLADLRRHYDQQHARNQVQYFCSVSGCSRSAAPTGGNGKGRSFGTRKDKRDEHERNVHKKRSASFEDEEEEEEEEDST